MFEDGEEEDEHLFHIDGTDQSFVTQVPLSSLFLSFFLSVILTYLIRKLSNYYDQNLNSSSSLSVL